MNTESIIERRAYTTPVVTVYGSMQELTALGTLGPTDSLYGTPGSDFSGPGGVS